MSRRYIKGIAGLRALAVLSVVAFHINKLWLPGGFVGVDVFFVISGFVVTHSVTGIVHKSFRSYFASFYMRRFQRILPAAFLYIFVATLAALIFVPLVSATKFLEPTGIAAIFGMSNVVLLLKAGDYFAVGSDLNLFTHTWSLAVEEQFYAFFPFFSYPILVAQGRLKRFRSVSLCIVGALCAASIVAAAELSVKAPTFAFYMLPTRFWELGVGLFLRIFLSTPLAEGLTFKFKAASPIIGFAALLGLGWSFRFTDATAFPFPGAILPCVSTALLIAVLWGYPLTWVDRILSQRPFTWFGDLSYSLYLWHWGVVVLMRWTVGLDTLPLQLIALGSMITLAWLSYTFVERLFQTRNKGRLLRPGTVLIPYGIAAATLAIIVGTSYILKPRIGIASANEAVAWDPAIAPGLPPKCAPKKLLASVGPGLQVTFPTSCKREGSPRVFIVGDSHAGAYMRSLLRIAASGYFRPYLMTFGNCRIVDVAAALPIAGCSRFREVATEKITRLVQKGDIIFLAGLHTPRFPSLDSDEVLPASNRIDYLQLAASRIRLGELSALGAKIIVEGPKPVMPFPLYRCADWFNRINDECRTPSDVTPQTEWHRMDVPLRGLKLAIAGIPNVVLWEPSSYLCDHERCQAYRDGRPLYYDGDHLSGYGNDMLTQPLLNEFRLVEASNATKLHMQEH